jgi:hypothetical protein
MDYPSEELVVQPIFVLPNESFSRILNNTKSDKHDLGDSEDEVPNGRDIADVAAATFEEPAALPKLQMKEEKPKIFISTPKRADLKIKLNLPITPSIPQPASLILPAKASVMPKIALDRPSQEVKGVTQSSPLKLKLSMPSSTVPVPVTIPRPKISLSLKNINSSELKEPAVPLPEAKPESEMAFAARVLDRLIGMKQSAYFQLPVDPVKLNIPNYPAIVKHPMDLGTVRSKLRQAQYESLLQFENDVLLVFRNCFTFNSIDCEVYRSGKKLQSIFIKEMKEAPFKMAAKRRLDAETARLIEEILTKLMNDPRASAFLDPVNYVELNLVKYPDIVLHPMDLSTIKSRLESHGFRFVENIKEFVLLVFSNCMHFNVENSLIYQYASELQEMFLSKWSELVDPLMTGLRTMEPAEVFLELTKSLSSHEYAAPFATPVDYLALNIPTYPKIVKNPMDFSTISTRVKSGKYLTPEEFKQDVVLTFTNCYAFNGASAPISLCARALEDKFVAEFNSFFPSREISLVELKKKK